MTTYHKAVLFYNEKSGQIESEQSLIQIQTFFEKRNIPMQTILVPQPEADLKEKFRQAVTDGTDLFIAAGGDGTVALVGDLLIDQPFPLGIIPLGTGNLLTKQLKIPQKLPDALNTIVSPESRLVKIDTLAFDGHDYIMNVSVGVSSQIMVQTPSHEKKRLGFFAYLKYFIQQILGLQLQRFNINIDGEEFSTLASEVMIANGRLIALDPLEWSEDVHIDDGELDLFTVRAANFKDILSFVISVFTKRTWRNPIVHHFKIKDFCQIETAHPLPIQADGDPFGETPLKVVVHPLSLNIIVPGQNATKNVFNLRERIKNERI